MSTSGGTSGGSGGAASSLTRTWSADGPAPGFALYLDSDYVPGPTAPEPLMCMSSASGTPQKTFWLSENLVPRIASSKASDVALKINGVTGGNQAGDLIQVFKEFQGAYLWGIDKWGNPVIGSGKVAGSNVVILGSSDPIPAGLPDGTVIGRTA